MKLKLPKIFAQRLEIQQHLRKVSWLDRIVYYWLDRNVAKSVELSSWINKQLDDPVVETLSSQLDGLKYMNNFERVKGVLRFVQNNIVYKSDSDVWKVREKWQTPSETWNLKTGDCEDGAILIYCLLRKLGVPEIQLHIVCGNVIGGGHCWVNWLSDEDGLEYPVDWCYWFNQSVKFNEPYVSRIEYNYGLMEWFRFNSSGGYISK